MTFNRGKPYHGSEAIENGKLRGKTGRTDYFFFLCPQCVDDQMLRILEYVSRHADPPVKKLGAKKPEEYFNLAFHIYCPNCQFEDFVKIANNHESEQLNPG